MARVLHLHLSILIIMSVLCSFLYVHSEYVDGQTGGTISGYVYDAQTCMRISNAQVSVQDVFSSWNYTTDNMGQFSTSPLSAGQYVVHVTKEGYHYANIDVTVYNGVNTAITCALEPLGKVRGIVQNTLSEYIHNASVTLSSEEGAFASVQTNILGEYTIEGLEDGYYTIQASAEGYVNSAPITVEVAANITTWQNITLIRSAYIYGKVTTPEGNPIQYAHVYAFNYEGHYSDDITDINGWYNLSTNLGEGNYKIIAHAEGYISNQSSVNLVAGSGIRHDISLRCSAILTGIVRSNGSAYIAGALVSAMDNKGNVYSNITNENGVYLINTELDTGIYTITASAPGHIVEHFRGISLTAGTTLTFNVYLNRSGILTGRVTDEELNPIPNATVEAHNDQDFGDSATTDEDGYYTISNNIASGTYYVEISAQGYKKQSLMNVELFAGQSVTRDVILFEFLKITSPENGSTVDEPLLLLMGSTEPNAEVVIEIVGDPDSHVELNADLESGFFEYMLTLSEGNNTISVRAISEDYSEEKRITVELVIPPSVDILKPMDGQEWTDELLVVEGTASDSNEGTDVSVYVSIDNGTTWHLAKGHGNWKAEFNLTPSYNGKRTIKVKAIEGSGHTLEKTIIINVSISSISRQVRIDTIHNIDANIGEITKITFNVKNNGSEIDSFIINCTNTDSWNVFISPIELQNVQPGISRKVTLTIDVPKDATISKPNFFTIKVSSLVDDNCMDSVSFAITPKKASEGNADKTFYLMIAIYLVAFLAFVSTLFYYRSVKSAQQAVKKGMGKEYATENLEFQSYLPERRGKAKKKR